MVNTLNICINVFWGDHIWQPGSTVATTVLQDNLDTLFNILNYTWTIHGVWTSTLHCHQFSIMYISSEIWFCLISFGLFWHYILSSNWQCYVDFQTGSDINFSQHLVHNFKVLTSDKVMVHFVSSLKLFSNNNYGSN